MLLLLSYRDTYFLHPGSMVFKGTDFHAYKEKKQNRKRGISFMRQNEFLSFAHIQFLGNLIPVKKLITWL